MAKPLWCVNIHGPDDIIATPDYETAVFAANIINDQIAAIVVRHFDPVHSPRMWALPAPWPWADDYHAESLGDETQEHFATVRMASEALAKARAEPVSADGLAEPSNAQIRPHHPKDRGAEEAALFDETQEIGSVPGAVR